MARISGIDIPKEKEELLLLPIFTAQVKAEPKNIKKADVSEDKKVHEWSDDDTAKIRSAVSEFTIEGELRAENQINIKRLMDIGSYRGIRHRLGLPLRGQKTKNNSRTRKGKRKQQQIKRK